MMSTPAETDVVIVGGGLAGLTAAELLIADGRRVVLLEAGHRVGGRVRTVRAPIAGGQHVESGAEWVDTVHERMLRLLSRFGAGLEGAGQTWTTLRRWLYVDGGLADPETLLRASPGLHDELDRYETLSEVGVAALADPAHPELHPDAAALDRRTLAEVMTDADLGPIARLFITRDLQGEFAAEPHEVSLLSVTQQRALYEQAGMGHGTVRAHRVTGGLDRLTAGLADAVAPALRLGQPVVRIEHGDGVVVHTPSQAFRATDVVVACSLVPLRSVTFDPPLPDALAAAVAGLGYGTVTKTGVQYSRRWWPPGYATTESLVQRMYEPTIDQPGLGGVLMAYTGGDNGRRLAEMSEEQRVAVVADHQREMYGGTESPEIGFSRAWSAEPRFGGSYSNYRPGEITAYWDVLRRPAGRIHLAGEHTAMWTGYMEGAVESGETAANRIIESGR